MRTRTVLLLTTALASMMLASAAPAADMPRKAPPSIVAPALYNWSGFYIGVHGGGAWGTVESSLVDFDYGGYGESWIPGGFSGFPISSHTINGFLGGVQAGWNWQSGVLVLGVEGQFSLTNLEGKTPCVVAFTCSTDIDWVATLAARLGLAIDKALWYVKGGVAWADSNYQLTGSLFGPTFSTSASDTRFGVMFGAGVEYAFAPNWSAKIEYNYIDFGSETLEFPISNPGLMLSLLDGPRTITATADIDQKIHLIKAGINYRFGWDAPLAARY